VTTVAEVIGALDGVRDPELDEPLTELGFVGDVRIDGAVVHVRLRLPTYFCAPNFAYLMTSDAHDAVAALAGVERVSVVLDDHFASREIGRAVNDGDGFQAAFPGETDGDLSALRRLFVRKAFVARQASLCDALLRTGATHQDLATMKVRELPHTRESVRCLALRGELGLDPSPEASAFVRPDGTPLAVDQVSRWLRVARLVRLSLEGNAGLCRSLLSTRYRIPNGEEVWHEGSSSARVPPAAKA
jgi:metal-sulfur cluster biosynthetic enzyme